MPHDVFISYSYVESDKIEAGKVRLFLEAEGFSCWMAPRDVLEGDDFGAAIAKAIQECRVLVLIFSAAANASRQIARELKLADDAQRPVLPIRIENVVPSGSFAYFLGAAHWLDAVGGVQEEQLRRLALGLRRRLVSISKVGTPAADESSQRDAAVLSDSMSTEPSVPVPISVPVIRRYRGVLWSTTVVLYVSVWVALAAIGIFAWSNRTTGTKIPAGVPSTTAIGKSDDLGAHSSPLPVVIPPAPVRLRGPVKLGLQNFHCENDSCESRKACSVTKSWTLPDPKCHVVRVEFANGPLMRNQSDMSLESMGSRVTAVGTLDTATCITAPLVPAKILHSTVYDVNATLVVVCPAQ